MTKSHYFTLFILGLASGTILCGTSVQADDQTSDATFSLTAPAAGKDLVLNRVSSLDFGTVELSNEPIRTNSTTDSILNLADLRGTGAGWTITGKLSDFISRSNTLKGAEITFTSGNATTEGVQNNTNPVVNDCTILAGGSAIKFVDAGVGQGNGVWTIEYQKDTVQLVAPSGQLKGNYTATLTYTLADVPTP